MSPSWASATTRFFAKTATSPSPPSIRTSPLPPAKPASFSTRSCHQPPPTRHQPPSSFRLPASSLGFRPKRWRIRIRPSARLSCLSTGTSIVRSAQRKRQKTSVCRVRPSIIREILSQRLRRAKRLLKDESIKLSAIAKACGFCNASYFANTFRRETGLKPKDWRRQSVLS